MTDNTTPHSSNNYDESIVKTIPYYGLFHKETIDLVKTIKPNVRRWIDTGCGTGHLAGLAIPGFPDCTFLLADPSAAMLDVCKIKFEGTTNIIILSPAGTEALADDRLNDCDVITAIQSHHYFQENARKLATEKCFSLLAQTGLYITFENIKPDTETGIRYGLERWNNFQLAAGMSQETVATHKKRFGTNYFPITVWEHMKLLKETGFSVVELFWRSHMQAGFYAIK